MENKNGLLVFQGKGLKGYRVEAKLSQGELAKLMGYSTPQFISNIENGKASIPSHDIPNLAKILSVEPKELAKLKLLDFILKLSYEANVPELKRFAKLITANEKDLKKYITESEIDQLFLKPKLLT